MVGAPDDADLVQASSGAVDGLKDGAPRAEAHRASLVRCATFRHEDDGRTRRCRVKLRAVRGLLTDHVASKLNDRYLYTAHESPTGAERSSRSNADCVPSCTLA